MSRGQHSYCSNECQMATHRAKVLAKKCSYCGKPFTIPDYSGKRKYCSHSCSNLARRGITYTGNKLLHNQARLLIELSKRSGCDHCMVDGCSYSKTLDVHRLTQGKFGGKYGFDNIYAICPNHHAELHRGVITLVPIGEFQLKALETGVLSQLAKYTTASTKVDAEAVLHRHSTGYEPMVGQLRYDPSLVLSLPSLRS